MYVYTHQGVRQVGGACVWLRCHAAVFRWTPSRAAVVFAGFSCVALLV